MKLGRDVVRGSGHLLPKKVKENINFPLNYGTLKCRERGGRFIFAFFLRGVTGREMNIFSCFFR